MKNNYRKDYNILLEADLLLLFFPEMIGKWYIDKYAWKPIIKRLREARQAEEKMIKKIIALNRGSGNHNSWEV